MLWGFNMGKKLFPHVPNILSAFRIALVPVFVIAYFRDTGDIKTWALAVYLLASVTDALDGIIARKYNLISNLGKVLDPLGDKLMLFAALTCITIDELIPIWAIILIGIKDALMGVGGIVIHRRAKVEIPPSNIIGKSATVVFMVVCVVLMVFPQMPDSASTALISVAILLTFAALISYIMTYSAVMKKRAGKGE